MSDTEIRQLRLEVGRLNTALIAARNGNRQKRDDFANKVSAELAVIVMRLDELEAKLAAWEEES